MNAKLNPYVIVTENNLVADTYKCKNGEQAEKSS